jgi:hypothetical protein
MPYSCHSYGSALTTQAENADEPPQCLSVCFWWRRWLTAFIVPVTSITRKRHDPLSRMNSGTAPLPEDKFPPLDVARIAETPQRRKKPAWMDTD